MTVARGQQQEQWVSGAYRAMQWAIAGNLRIRYEPPKELTPQLRKLMAAMDQVDD
jgi:hypothetical protein